MSDANGIRNAIIAFKKMAQYRVEERFNTPHGYIKVVEVNDEEEASEDYNDYEATQGWTGTAWITFHVESGDRYFRQFGTLNSYYEARWDGEFKEVFPKTKEVIVFEYQ